MQTRNGYIDLGKFIAALFVIAIHTQPFQDISVDIDFFFVDIICRMAVPFFAICTGFYFTKAINNSTGVVVFKKTFFKITKMYLSWSFFYLIILLIDWHNSGILSINIFTGWCKSLLLNSSYYHLWYLISLLYALPLFFIIINNVSKKCCLGIAIFLWILESISYGYSFLVPFISSKFSIISSFEAFNTGILRMLPLLLIGAWISGKDLTAPSINRSVLIFLLFFLLLVIEATLIRYWGGDHFSFIFMTPALSASAFVLLYIRGLNFQLLAKASMTIYCLHPAIIWLLNGFISSRLFLYLSVTIITAFISIVYHRYKICLRKII